MVKDKEDRAGDGAAVRIGRECRSEERRAPIDDGSSWAVGRRITMFGNGLT